MPIGRYRSPATITTVPRDTLVHAHHREIDAILKDLRLCSRRLKSVLDGFNAELHILERLYYKCKNQHRTALFFKRVPEMRRWGRRLSELNVLERLDLLRASFVGLEHTNDHRALRGPWSRVPEKLHVYFLAERLTACSTLAHKMRERLERAYHHFTLAMQTGAFVQFIILFVAISSRMSLLSSQLEEALQLSISACNRLLAIVHPTGTCATVSQQPFPRTETSRPSHVDHGVPLEDTEQSVAADPTSEMEATLEMHVTHPSSQPANAGDQSTAQASEKATAKVNQKPRPKKKAKKKFDEIDEIFGF